MAKIDIFSLVVNKNLSIVELFKKIEQKILFWAFVLALPAF